MRPRRRLAKGKDGVQHKGNMKEGLQHMGAYMGRACVGVRCKSMGCIRRMGSQGGCLACRLHAVDTKDNHGLAAPRDGKPCGVKRWKAHGTRGVERETWPKSCVGRSARLGKGTWSPSLIGLDHNRQWNQCLNSIAPRVRIDLLLFFLIC